MKRVSHTLVRVFDAMNHPGHLQSRVKFGNFSGVLNGNGNDIDQGIGLVSLFARIGKLSESEKQRSVGR